MYPQQIKIKADFRNFIVFWFFVFPVHTGNTFDLMRHRDRQSVEPELRPFADFAPRLDSDCSVIRFRIDNHQHSLQQVSVTIWSKIKRSLVIIVLVRPQTLL